MQGHTHMSNIASLPINGSPWNTPQIPRTLSHFLFFGIKCQDILSYILTPKPKFSLVLDHFKRMFTKWCLLIVYERKADMMKEAGMNVEGMNVTPLS